MDPIVISSTIQEFQGRRYYRDGKTRYFRTSHTHGRRHLHVDVWRHHHGNIPHGWEVHHWDDDRAHNVYANLQAMAPRDHRRLHPPVYEPAIPCPHCGKPLPRERRK